MLLYFLNGSHQNLINMRNDQEFIKVFDGAIYKKIKLTNWNALEVYMCGHALHCSIAEVFNAQSLSDATAALTSGVVRPVRIDSINHLTAFCQISEPVRIAVYTCTVS